MVLSKRAFSRRAVAIGLAVITALAALPLRGQAQSGSKAALKDIRLGVFPITDAAVPLLGLDRGIFEKHGINLLPTTLSTASIVQSTTSGQVDLALNSLQHSVSAASAGLPLSVVAGLSVWAKGVAGADPDGLIVLKDGPKTGADFNGKTIAVVALNSADELAARVTIDRHGGDANSLKFTVLPAAAMRGALQNGDVQGAVIHDPFYRSFMATGEFAAPLGNPNFQAFADLPRLVVISSKDFVGAHQPELRAFQAAMQESIDLALSDPDAVSATLVKWFKTPEADAKASTLPKLRATVTVEQVAAVEKLSQDYKFIKGDVDPAALVFQ
ncbi:ABC transporter substrate-binding protein [Labrys sp. KB_33_2]|uniref:ABC transporter substrate-binding protein n=1 Tax=Labrys sp. KB_33_2 TaxID=3237479 RepID=UPI003F9162AB